MDGKLKFVNKENFERITFRKFFKKFEKKLKLVQKKSLKENFQEKCEKFEGKLIFNNKKF